MLCSRYFKSYFIHKLPSPQMSQMEVKFDQQIQAKDAELQSKQEELNKTQRELDDCKKQVSGLSVELIKGS